MTGKPTFAELEAELSRTRAALTDAIHGWNDVAMKLAVCGALIGFGTDETKEQIRDAIRERLK